MTIATILGFPRIGARRELKLALEGFWKGEIDATALEDTARTIRRRNWQSQAAHGIRHIPSNDFSLYDHVLDTSVLVGAVPPRYRWSGGSVDLATYFAMARGAQTGALDAHAMEMTKWFDTNYHYLVPEFAKDQDFRLSSTKPVDEYREAKAEGVATRPVLLGPVSYLLLGKAREGAFDPLVLLPRLLPVYEEVLRALAVAGAEWVQVDEPCLVTDLGDGGRRAYREAYERLAVAAPLKLLVASYFGALDENCDTAFALPVAGLHLDLVRGATQLDDALARVGERWLSLGVVDGRNIWCTDLARALALIERATTKVDPRRLMVAPSCSLLHVPLDLGAEKTLDARLRPWLAFAYEKLDEIALLARGLAEGRGSIERELRAATAAIENRRLASWHRNAAVSERLARVSSDMTQRHASIEERRGCQAAHLKLPVLPTTTIGSFPQTEAVRKARAAFKRGATRAADYTAYVKGEIERAVRWQEAIGLDVLVHGEFERNDMVQFFAEMLDGFAVTENGWVQSYGSRYVKPPIIYGDVARRGPLTVALAEYAQTLTAKLVKGMLTGPVTILQWSFARDDIPRESACRQIAFALRDEVVDLEAHGIRIIQIDEPALREGAPLRRAERDSYLGWAVECFRLSASGVGDETQIHTHMCYAEFGDILETIAELDADVVSIETSRSHMELLDEFRRVRFPSEIGPGIYDIHAPRVPSSGEIAGLLRMALDRLPAERLWVNPDCGLKTRRWEEIEPALRNMVEAARMLRQSVAPATPAAS